MRRVLTLALATAGTLAIATPASASLQFDPTATALIGQGFGNVPRDLTVHGTGQTDPESGCISVVNSATLAGGASSCISDGSVHDGNGTTNAGGSEEPPVADNQKHGIPTVGDLGITTAADIGILFNATDPGGDGVNLVDLTLKFYSANGTLLGAIDGSHTFTGTEVGNGSAGFVFDVDAGELAYVNGILGLGGTIYMSLEATISDAEGGPESFTIFNLHSPPPTVPEPATWAMMLLGFGGIGMAMRRRRNGQLLQIA